MMARKSNIPQLFWRKIKRFFEWIIYGLFDRTVLAGQKYLPNESIVAVVQLKLLGDFILWLPYGKALVRHCELLQKNVVIIANASILPLAERLFPYCKVIGINRTEFTRDHAARTASLRELRHLGVGITYLDTHPRDAIIEDATVRALGAPTWSFDSTFSDRSWIDRWLSRRLYTRLLPAMGNVHQSFRHRSFLLASGVPETELTLNPDLVSGLDRPLRSSYFVIAPGASRSEKCWPVNHFITVAQRTLIEHPDWICIILGTQNERALGDEIVQALSDKGHNCAGETELLDFVRWIAHAKLVIGNDSAACHIAAACGVASFPIVGGGHPGWFFPYPPNSSVQKLPVTIVEPMDCFGCNWMCRYQVDKGEPFPCIAAIRPEQVLKQIEKIV
jgi:hypothetical protein